MSSQRHHVLRGAALVGLVVADDPNPDEALVVNPFGAVSVKGPLLVAYTQLLNVLYRIPSACQMQTIPYIGGSADLHLHHKHLVGLFPTVLQGGLLSRPSSGAKGGCELLHLFHFFVFVVEGFGDEN